MLLLCHQLAMRVARPVSSAEADIVWSAGMAAVVGITVSAALSQFRCLDFLVPWCRSVYGG